VRPALARGDVVIQDRYLDSSVAYQGAGRVLDAEQVRDLSLWATEGRCRSHGAARPRPGVRAARLDAADKPFDRLEAEKSEFQRARRPRRPRLVLDAARRRARPPAPRPPR
jgi:dTMP kinase